MLKEKLQSFIERDPELVEKLKIHRELLIQIRRVYEAFNSKRNELMILDLSVAISKYNGLLREDLEENMLKIVDLKSAALSVKRAYESTPQPLHITMSVLVEILRDLNNLIYDSIEPE